MTVTLKKAVQILKYWNLEKETITDIYYEGTGNRNDNAYFVGERYILKYTCNFGKLKKHIEVSNALQSIGLLSAVPVLTCDGAEYIRDGEVYFYLTRRLPGKQMVAHSFGEGNGRFVGEIIGQLHGILLQAQLEARAGSLLEDVRGWALAQAKPLLKLPEEFWRSYLERFETLYPALPRQLIHRDLNPSVILRNTEGWGLIDFERAEENIRLFDPCYAATAVLSESFENAQKLDDWIGIYQNILAGYDSVVHLTQEEREAAPYVVLANQLVCVAWFANQPQYAQLARTNCLMTRWLAECFEQLKL